jgi:hypothetical protein
MRGGELKKMKTQSWIIKSDGIGIMTVKTSLNANRQIAINKAVYRLPLTAIFHKLSADKIEEGQVNI